MKYPNNTVRAMDRYCIKKEDPMFGRNVNVKEFNPQEYYGVDGATIVFYDRAKLSGLSTFEYTIANPDDRTRVVSEILKKIATGENITLDPAVTDPRRVVIYRTPPYREPGL